MKLITKNFRLTDHRATGVKMRDARKRKRVSVYAMPRSGWNIFRALSF